MCEKNSNNKIDCQLLKSWLIEQEQSLYNSNLNKKIQGLQLIITDLNKYLILKEVEQKSTNEQDKVLLNLRTYICAKGNCIYYSNRNHQRIKNYNLCNRTYLPC